jgi:hypothetical protein
MEVHMAKKKSKINIRTIAFLSASTLGVLGWSGYDYQPLVSARKTGSRVITQIKENFEALKDWADEQIEALTGHESSRK